MFKERFVADDNGECAVLARELTSRFDDRNRCSCKVLDQWTQLRKFPTTISISSFISAAFASACMLVTHHSYAWTSLKLRVCWRQRSNWEILVSSSYEKNNSCEWGGTAAINKQIINRLLPKSFFISVMINLLVWTRFLI